MKTTKKFSAELETIPTSYRAAVLAASKGMRRLSVHMDQGYAILEGTMYGHQVSFIVDQSSVVCETTSPYGQTLLGK